MPSDPHNHRVDAAGLERKHESCNPPAGQLFFYAGVTVCTLLVSFVIVHLMMKGWTIERPIDGAQRFIIATNLPVSAHEYLLQSRSNEETQLNSYGWVDGSNGVVRIPIEQAMNLLVQRGLPTNAAQEGKSPEELIRERTQWR